MKLIKAAAFIFFAAGLSAQEIHAETFSELDFVEFSTPPGGIEYVIGEDLQSVTAKRKVFSFRLNRYETTYSLWYKVRLWAEENGYVFANPGQEGSGGQRGKSPSQMNCYEPVTGINWYDALVWCNALSEMEGLAPSYSYKGNVLRDATDTVSCDLAECDWQSKSYRLPSETEWEYAARKTPAGLQPGDLASGQIDAAGKGDSSVCADEVAWYFENTGGTRRVGTAGTPFSTSAPPSPSSGNPNGAGIFDMSGNVLEFCWDWEAPYKAVDLSERYSGPQFGSERIMRGGSWNKYTMFISAADRYSYDPNEAYNFFGFRIAAGVE
ncbi:formylglycine-generating enzyme family protein [Treponema sp.]|uniref:formylglycine-generating enzyme family protein n=1 Tax=Treponema sp. TaxID=166 RepID=UPI003F05EB20